MSRQLKCFLSASYETDLSSVKSVLEENNVEVFDLYDFSIGDSLQQILKRKLREADFAIFVISKDSKNILYEIGVCEGLGRQSFIIIDNETELPFYLQNKLSLTTNLENKEFLKISLEGFINEIRLNIKPSKPIKTTQKKREITYSAEVKGELYVLLKRIQEARISNSSEVLEYIISNVFRAIKLNYVDNTKTDKGIDFAIWSNELGRIIGNPVIVELKTGVITDDRIRRAQSQIQEYINLAEAKAGLLLYLDNTGQRFQFTPTLEPLIIAYDAEDFINDLIESSFENIILTSRNKIAHRN